MSMLLLRKMALYKTVIGMLFEAIFHIQEHFVCFSCYLVKHELRPISDRLCLKLSTTCKILSTSHI